MMKDYFQREMRLVLVETSSGGLTLKKTAEVSSEKAPVSSPARLETGVEKEGNPVDHPLVQEALKVLGGKVIDTKQRPKNLP